MLIYFRGCLAREKLKSISDATESLLREAGVDYRVLDDETCCGSVLLRTGFLEEARRQMDDTAAKLGDSEVVVSCAGCYRTIKTDYAREGYTVRVKHISQLLLELIESGRLDLNKINIRVTYHDPCHLSRHTGETSAPRELIGKFAELVEMENHGADSRCCGAGGGVRSAHPEISDKVASERLKDAKETGADVLCTACPFCRLNLESDTVEVLDITELMERALRGRHGNE